MCVCVFGDTWSTSAHKQRHWLTLPLSAKWRGLDHMTGKCFVSEIINPSDITDMYTEGVKKVKSMQKLGIEVIRTQSQP